MYKNRIYNDRMEYKSRWNGNKLCYCKFCIK